MKYPRNTGRGLAAIAVASSILFIPTNVFAKSNSKEKTNARARSAQTASCPTSGYGHFIAPGWQKKNGTSAIPANCVLPYGIAKKVYGSYATTTATTTDTTAPTISSVVVTPGITTAVMAWNTNEAADSAVFFSSSLPVNTSATATQVVSSNTKVLSHNATLTNLNASTTYYAVIRSRDAAGNVSTSFPVTFTTTNLADSAAPILTNFITFVGTSTVRITWNTNELSTSKIFYSTTTPVATSSTSTPFVEDNSFTFNHSVTLTGLSTSTLYRILIQSRDMSGNIGSGIEFPVTTSH